jgi:hypothetical protein
MKKNTPVMSAAMWTFTACCTFIIILLSLVVRHFSGVYTGYRNNMSYYLKKSYSGHADLFATMLEKPSMFFLWCCDCILFYANRYGMSYAELNLYLFVIGQPMLILLFLGLFVMQTRRLRERVLIR